MMPSNQAEEYIITHCRGIGTFHGDGRPFAFLDQLSKDMNASQATTLFPDRYKEHVAYAVGIVASNHFTSSPAAVSAVYLATRFEFYFRALSKRFNMDGTWLSEELKADAISSIKDLKIKNRLNRRQISSLSLTYRLMLLNTSSPIVQQFMRIDESLYKEPSKVVGGSEVYNIGDRIAFGRNAVGHGSLGDISSEAIFYGLVTGIVFYSQV